MRPSDLPACHDLWSSADGVEISEGDSPAELTRFLQRNPGFSTVAYEDSRLVGAVLCGHDGRRGYAYHLAVAREFRGRGLGRTIMQRSLGELKAAGIVRALLLVMDDNENGRQFWRRAGWEDMPSVRSMGIDL